MYLSKYTSHNFSQVTLEEQMICGALQTLNEEACEDVLEETEETELVVDPDLPQTSIIPPSPDAVQGESQKIVFIKPNLSKSNLKKVTYNETDSIITMKANSSSQFKE